MRTLKLLSLGLTCFLAGTTFQGQKQEQQQPNGPIKPQVGVTPESISAKDDPFYRVDCDDWARLRPSETTVWEKMVAADMTLEEAVFLAVEYAKEERNYPTVRVLSAQFVGGDKPFYEVEVLTWNDKKDKAQRWQVYIGLKLKQVKRWLILERFPGTPVREDKAPLIETESGLLIHDVRPGDGLEATADSTVQVQYVGSILDGTIVFDTYDARNPETFKLSKAPLRGMTEGLVGVRAGGKRKLILPPSLAYGDQGFGGVVPPNAAVILDIEILRVD
jgi:hypothetical protein